MASRLQTLIDLLHSPGDIALATHAVAVPGYPYATSVAFAPDEHHRPVMLLSRLAEHTKNLIADPRASLVFARNLGEGEIARASIVGNVAEIESDPLLVARYLRFNPHAERLLQLGDFNFYRIEPVRIRVVGGFAQAGWLDGRQLLDAPHISLEDEGKLIEETHPTVPAGVVLLGVDAYGADYMREGSRGRIEFKTGPVAVDAAKAALKRAIKKL